MIYLYISSHLICLLQKSLSNSQKIIGVYFFIENIGHLSANLSMIEFRLYTFFDFIIYVFIYHLRFR